MIIDHDVRLLLVEEANLLEEFSIDGILSVADVDDSVQAGVLEKRNIDVHCVVFGNLKFVFRRVLIKAVCL